MDSLTENQGPRWKQELDFVVLTMSQHAGILFFSLLLDLNFCPVNGTKHRQEHLPVTTGCTRWGGQTKDKPINAKSWCHSAKILLRGLDIQVVGGYLLNYVEELLISGTPGTPLAWVAVHFLKAVLVFSLLQRNWTPISSKNDAVTKVSMTQKIYFYLIRWSSRQLCSADCLVSLWSWLRVQIVMKWRANLQA